MQVRWAAAIASLDSQRSALSRQRKPSREASPPREPRRWKDPLADPDWHPDPADHPPRVAVGLKPKEDTWRRDASQEAAADTHTGLG